MEINQIAEKNSVNITKEERDAYMERLKVALKKRNTNVASLQLQLGKANAYFRNMGYVTKQMEQRIHEIIPDLNIEYINEGKGEMFLEGVCQKPINNKASADNTRFVPLLTTAAHGGSLVGFDEQGSVYSYEKVISPVCNADLALTVTGDSMSPEYPNGCRVFVRKINEVAFIDWGATYVLDTVNGVIVKNIFPNDDESKVTCRSVNKEYPDFCVNKSDIRGWYKVVLQMSLK